MRTSVAALLAWLVITTCGNFGMAGDAPAADARHTFKVAYANALQPNERRALVIDAVDSGVIFRGESYNDLKELFGKHLNDLGTNANAGRRAAVVFFSPVIPARNAIESAVQEGWYIDLKFDSEDRLSHYSLSNLHK